MNIEKAVVEFGTEAALHYRKLADAKRDNELPLGFMRSHVAVRLSDHLGLPIHIERQLAVVAHELGASVTPDLLMVLGGAVADLAIYEGGRPSAVVQLEIFDHAAPLPSVGASLHKARVLARLSRLDVFFGVMICPVGASLEARVERLHDAVGGNLYVGERQSSRDQTWQWCFACAAIED